MDLEIRHLRLVSAVAESQSLTKAGHVLHLTQSALSHQLRDIESRLRAPLFLRVNKRMVLTPAGERVLETARVVISQMEATEDAIRRGVTGQPVSLRLSTECYTVYHWLPAVLKPFKIQFPHVDVQIDVDATKGPLKVLLDGALDLAIMTDAPKDARLVTRPLFEDEQVLLVSSAHRLAGRPYARLADFRHERLFTYSSREDSHFFTKLLRPAGVIPHAIDSIRLSEAMIELVRAGLGVAVLARWAVQSHLADGSLRAIRVTQDGVFKQWQAVVPKHLVTADYITEFIRLLVAQAPIRSTSPSVVPFRERRGSRAAG